jgi:hypothetical protein
MDRRPLSTFTRRGARSPLIRALAGFALCAAATVYANDEPGQASLGSALTEAAVPSGFADISWLLPTQNADTTALTDLAGILICYGTSASNLSRCVVANGESATNYTVTGLSAGTWYFVAQAFTTGGGLSPPTPMVSKTIP